MTSLFFISELLKDQALAKFLRDLKKSLIIVTDSNMAFYAEAIQTYLDKNTLLAELIIFPAGEEYKTRETKSWIEDQLLSKHYGRDTCLLAVGGGVVTDMVGFVAATYCRGVDVVYIPTTLLAMVDASIGGKTGVDTSYGKNMIGSFYPPTAIFIDTQVLETLPQDQFANGMSEVIKHALIADADLFLTLQKNFPNALDKNFIHTVIQKSIHIKQAIVQQDEKDHSIRHLLNFGHTIGHTVEVIDHFQIAHGQAVAIGMIVEAYLSLQLGYLALAEFLAIEKLIRAWHPHLKTSAFENGDLFKKALKSDKKNKNQHVHFVLLNEIGKPYHHSTQYAFAVKKDVLDNVLIWANTHFEKIYFNKNK